MFYVLNERFRLRGWKKVPYALFDTKSKTPKFLNREKFAFISKCDGLHFMTEESLPEKEKNLLEALLKEDIVRESRFGETLRPEQEYKLYPCRYKREVHWSVTGKCNLKCRHCFMSAPKGKHGNPTYAQLLSVMDQFEECGIAQVGITGGEPLIRPDFMDIVRELTRREMGITCIFTNGWLLDEKLLDEIEALGITPPFQLSFDGVGQHDFLRGIEGCEARTLSALKLLQKRGYRASVSTCLHRGNVHTVRETVNLMASLGVHSMKISASMELGEWAAPELKALSLTPTEEMEAFEKYIPQFFEDGAPLSVVLSGTFSYNKSRESWGFSFFRPCPANLEGKLLSCPTIKKAFYLGAEGMVSPCMGMCDCDFAENLPNVYETPLREILSDSPFMDLCAATVADVRDGNRKCRSCEHLKKCAGGCRNTALIKSNNFYDPDPQACFFFENGWDEKLKAAAEKSYTQYCGKNGIEPKKANGPMNESEETC